MRSVQVLVMGGLPITVEFSIGEPEPDVGIMSAYLDEWRITHIGERRIKPNEKTNWIYSRLSKKDHETICHACLSE